MGRVPVVSPPASSPCWRGWFTAEIGRQPWVVYGLLRTKDAVTPSLVTADVVFSLLAYIAVYAVIYSFGLYYIYRLLRDGPAGDVSAAVPGGGTSRRHRGRRATETDRMDPRAWRCSGPA